jgi:hypothetical protein
MSILVREKEVQDFGLQVLTAVTVKSTVFRNVTLCTVRSSEL